MHYLLFDNWYDDLQDKDIDSFIDEIDLMKDWYKQMVAKNRNLYWLYQIYHMASSDTKRRGKKDRE